MENKSCNNCYNRQDSKSCSAMWPNCYEETLKRYKPDYKTLESQLSTANDLLDDVKNAIYFNVGLIGDSKMFDEFDQLLTRLELR